MRYLVFAVLVLVPSTLIGWIAWQGQHAPATAPAASASAGARSPDADAALVALFKGSPGGAKAKEKVALYDEKGLFDYIDGAAPLYIQRHFRKLAAAEMATPEGSELTCDVYDMAAPDNAQAIFDAEKSPSARAVAGWAKAVSGPMSFVFSNGRYYVKLTAFDKKAEAVLPGLAAALRERMQ